MKYTKLDCKSMSMQGCMFTVFVHSTGATEIDHFMAQAKKNLYHHQTSLKTTTSSAVNYTNRYVNGWDMNAAYKAHKIQILTINVFRQCFFLFMCT